MPTDNRNTDLNADGIMAKMLAEEQPEAKKNQGGNNEDDLPQLGFGLGTAAKSEQGSNTYGSSENTGSIWSRMKSSFYTGGTGYQTQIPKNSAGKDEEEEPGQKKRKLDPETSLRKILLEAKEEKERWELTDTAILEKDEIEEVDNDLPTDLSDELVGGTIILPPATEPSSDGKVSPDLSLRASMVDTDILPVAQEETKRSDSISILGSITDSIVMEDILGANEKEEIEDEAKKRTKDETNKEEGGKLREVAAPTNRNVGGGDDWGTSPFEAIGKQMYLSDNITSQNKDKENVNVVSPAPKFSKIKIVSIIGCVCIILSAVPLYGRYRTEVETPPVIPPFESNSPLVDIIADGYLTTEEPTDARVLPEEGLRTVNVTLPSASTPTDTIVTSVKFPPTKHSIGDFEDFADSSEVILSFLNLQNLDLGVLFTPSSLLALFASFLVSLAVAFLWVLPKLPQEMSAKPETKVSDKTKATKGRKHRSSVVIKTKKCTPRWLFIYHDMASIFPSMYTTEVLTKKGKLVEVKRSARNLTLTSSTKRE